MFTNHLENRSVSKVEEKTESNDEGEKDNSDISCKPQIKSKDESESKVEEKIDIDNKGGEDSSDILCKSQFKSEDEFVLKVEEKIDIDNKGGEDNSDIPCKSQPKSEDESVLKVEEKTETDNKGREDNSDIPYKTQLKSEDEYASMVEEKAESDKKGVEDNSDIPCKPQLKSEDESVLKVDEKPESNTKNGKDNCDIPCKPTLNSESKGNASDMNGHTFDCYNHTQFGKTMRQLEMYAVSTYKHGGDIKKMISRLKETRIEKPKLLKDGANRLEKEIWKKRSDLYVERKTMYAENKSKLFWVIWGQCSEEMRNKLELDDQYEDLEDNDDCVNLLNKIREICFSVDEKRYVPLAMLEAKSKLYNIRQGPKEGSKAYCERFTKEVAIVMEYGGSIGIDKALVEYEDTLLIGTERPQDEDGLNRQLEKKSQERYLAIMFLSQADPRRYGSLLNDMENNYAKGKNQFPLTIIDAYFMMLNYVPTIKNNNYYNRES